MPEQLRENLADIKEPQQEKEASFEIAKTEELKQVIDQANSLAGKIERDENVKVGQVLELEKDLENLKIDFYGEKLTIQQIKKIDDINEQSRINRLVMEHGGTFKSKLTYLTIKAAERIRKDSETDRIVDLKNVRSLTEKKAQILAECKGASLEIGLEEMSIEIALSLKNYQGNVLILNRLIKVPLEVAKIIRSFNCSMIAFKNLTVLSDESARYLSEFKGMITYGPKNIEFYQKNKKIWDKIEKGDFSAVVNMTHLSEDAAKTIAKQKGDYLNFTNLSFLSEEAARYLKDCQYKTLYFPNLLSLSEEAAKELSKFSGRISCKHDIAQYIKSFKK